MLKRELQKADALLDQLEQDDVIPTSPPSQPAAPDFYQPHSIIRHAQASSPVTKTSLGLDIGSNTIKAVELEHTPTGYKLLHYALVDIAAVEPPADYSQRFMEGIKKAITGINLAQTEVIISLGDSSIIIQQLSIPPISEPGLSSYIKWEAKKLIPSYNEQKTALEYQVLKEGNESSPMEILLVAIPRHLLLSNQELVTQAQIRPAITDMAPLALINAYLAEGKHKAEEPLVMLDMGAETTTLSIYRENSGYFVRYIPISGNHLTKWIQNQLGMEFLQAEQWKRQPQPGVIELLEPLLQQMILEIRKGLNLYRNQTLTRNFKRLILSGGCAKLSQLDNYLRRELGLKVRVFNPFTKLNINGNYLPQADLNGISSQFATAVGLAIRGFNQNSRLINLTTLLQP
jgi:type IV pilus assembly protein PilM